MARDEPGEVPGPRVAVVGGGVSGISTAWYLRCAGARVELIERAETLGGRIGLDRLGDEPIELGGKNITSSDLPTLIAELSRGLTLEAGDIIATGTPDGIGAVRQPPEFLKPGDVVECEIEGIGTLRHSVAP